MANRNAPNAKGRSGNGAAAAQVATPAPSTSTAAIVAADPEAETPPVAVNPFESLPVLKAGDYEVHDLTALPKEIALGAAGKYEAVATKAKELGIQMKQGWKHANAVFKIGSVGDEKKPTTVMGMIQQIVKGYGREGCPAIVLVTRLRESAVNNTRSHFCQGKLPTVGWAEGYVDGAINQNLIKVTGQMPNEIAAKSMVAVAPAAEGDKTEEKTAAAA